MIFVLVLGGEILMHPNLVEKEEERRRKAQTQKSVVLDGTKCFRMSKTSTTLTVNIT